MNQNKQHDEEKLYLRNKQYGEVESYLKTQYDEKKVDIKDKQYG